MFLELLTGNLKLLLDCVAAQDGSLTPTVTEANVTWCKERHAVIARLSTGGKRKYKSARMKNVGDLDKLQEEVDNKAKRLQTWYDKRLQVGLSGSSSSEI